MNNWIFAISLFGLGFVIWLLINLYKELEERFNHWFWNSCKPKEDKTVITIRLIKRNKENDND